MRWLITGGCGFLGTNLVGRLVAQGGHTLRVLDNVSTGSRQRLGAITGYRETPPHDTHAMSDVFETGGVELIDGDVRDMALCLRASEGAEVIVHLAASPGLSASLLEPRFDSETNVGGTLNMLEAARHCDAARFVFTSSFAAESPADTGAAVQPFSPFGAAKLAGEAYCFAYARNFGVETTALRLSSVYGPGDTAGIVGRLIRDIIKGKRIELPHGTDEIRDFLHVDDAVDALIAATAGPAHTDPATTPAKEPSRAFRVTNGEEVTLGEIVDLLDRLLSHAGYPPAQRATDSATDTVAAARVPSRSALPDLPGWRPATDLGSGIGRTVRWFMEQPDLRSVAA